MPFAFPCVTEGSKILACAGPGVGYGEYGCPLAVAPDREPAAAGHRLHRVVDEIYQDPQEAVLVRVQLAGELQIPHEYRDRSLLHGSPHVYVCAYVSDRPATVRAGDHVGESMH